MRFATVRKTALSVALLALVIVACPTAHAQTKAFKVSGDGFAPIGLSVDGFDSPYNATGNATHVGKYASPNNEGVAKVLSFNKATGAGTFTGGFTFVAPNGDRLACTHGDIGNKAAKVGTFQVFPAAVPGKVYAVFDAEFNPLLAKCTGRYKDVVGGSFRMIATTEPFVPVFDDKGFSPQFKYSWKGDGTIEFAKGKN